jgi:hypothetical protein
MTDATSESASRRYFFIAAGSLILALWLVTRPYLGIVHDSRLYTLQALARMNPAKMSADLFLAYGSQDRFSVISALYAPFIAGLGLLGGNITLLLLSQALWLASVFMLARRWLADRDAVIAGLVCTIAFPAVYVGIFRYGEPFFTARLPAEALVIFGIAALLARRRALSAVLMVAAALLHPLTALPGIVLAIIFEGRAQPRVWWLAGIGALVICGLAVAGVSPFDQLFQRFDPAWLAVVRLRNLYCYLGEWQLGEWLNLASITATTVLALVLGPLANRRLLVAAAATAALGMVTTLIGTDLLHNVLVTGLQTWRWLWVLALVSHIAMAPILIALLRGESTMPKNVGLPFLVALCALSLSWYIGIMAIVVVASTVTALVINYWAIRDRQLPLAVKILGLVSLIFLAAVTEAGILTLASSPYMDRQDWIETFISFAMEFGVVAALFWLFSQPTVMRRATPVFAGISLLLAITAASFWDQQTPWRHFVDSTIRPPAAVTALLEGPGQAYWEGDMTVLWLMTRQPSYFSCDQGGGVLFSRATAMAYAERRRAFRRFGVRELEGRACADPADPGRPPPHRDRASLTVLCRDQPDLGTVVLLTPVAGARARQWQSPVEYRDLRGMDASQPVIGTKRFYAYSCSDFRS